MPLSDHSKCVAYHPTDRKRLVTGSKDPIVRIWYDGNPQPVECKGHKGAVRAVAWSPCGQWIASGSVDGTLSLWRAADGELLCTFEGHTDEVTGVVFGPDSTRVASCSWDGSVRIWSVLDRSLRCSLTNDRKHSVTKLWCVAWSADGRLLAAGARDKTLRLWDAADGFRLRHLEGHTNDVSSVAFDPKSTCIASGSCDGTVRLWALSTGAELWHSTELDCEVRCVSFSPDGARIASGSADNQLRVWRRRDGALLRQEGHPGTVRGVAWSPDSTQIALASDDFTRSRFSPTS